MPPNSRKSIVWEFFSKSNNMVTCSLCSSSYKNFGNTSNLMSHLKRRHPIEFLGKGSRKITAPEETEVSFYYINADNTVECKSEEWTEINEETIVINQEDDAIFDQEDTKPAIIDENKKGKSAPAVLNNKGNKRSIAWDFFSKSGDKVICELCSTQCTYFGNTTNLIEHLKRKHPIELHGGRQDEVSSQETTVSNPVQQGKKRPSIPTPVNRESRRSVAWEFFSRSGNMVTCELCSRSYKNYGNTSNLISHLKRRHPIELLEGNQDEDISGQETTELSPKHPKKTPVSAPAAVDQTSIDDALVDMIVLDYQPLQIVENEGFKRFAQKLNPNYKLPSRKILSNNLLEDRYNICSASLKQILQEIEDMALTTDTWTSDNNKTYITLTAHFIINSKLNSFILSTSELELDYTSFDIAETIRSILEEWNIYDKIITVVTDNSESIEEAVNDYLSKRSHFCVAHTLNLAIEDCIVQDKDNTKNNHLKNNKLIELITKCRAIVSHFKRNIEASSKLKEIQRDRGFEQLKLIEDIPTRWSTTLSMLERLLKIKIALLATLPLLESPPSNLVSSEWSVLEDSIVLLKPIEKMTLILSEESYPILSCVIPLIRGLQNAIKNKNPKTDAGIHLQKSLLEVVDKRLSVYEINRTAATATFLDPRFKKTAFGLEGNADNAQKWVIEELSKDESLSHLDSPSELLTVKNASDQFTEDEESLDDLWEQLDKKISASSTEQTPVSSATMAVKQYLELPYLGRKQDPLQFWEEKKGNFPGLYKLACIYLCVPATSVPSERLFSKDGMLTYERRKMLLSKKVDQLLFLNSWCSTANKE